MSRRHPEAADLQKEKDETLINVSFKNYIKKRLIEVYLRILLGNYKKKTKKKKKH